MEGDGGKKHRAPVKDTGGGNRERSLAERRRRSLAIGTERRAAVLKSKRLRRGYEQDEPVDDQIASLDHAAFVVALNNGVREAKESKGDGGEKHLENIRYIRKVITESQDPPLQEALTAGVIPLLAAGMQSTVANSTVQAIAVESVWALAYLAGGAHQVAEAVLPLAGSLILHLSGQLGWHVAEVCAWALGNLAADCDEFADTIVAQGAVKPLMQLTYGVKNGWGEDNAHIVVAGGTAAWALSNLVRNSNVAGDHLIGFPSFVEKLIEMLGIGHVTFVSELLWLVVYLVAKNARNLEHLVKGGLAPHLVKIVADAVQVLEQDVSNSMTILIPVLRALGNVVAGASIEFADEILQSEGTTIAQCLLVCLQSTHRGILKEAAWAMSNIAGCPSGIGAEAIMGSGAVPHLLNLVCTAAFDIRKEVAFVLANLCMHKENQPNVDFLQQMVRSPKFLDTFMQFMRSPDKEAARLAVQFTEMVLRAVPGGVQMVEEVDGIDALEAVQYGDNPPDLQEMAGYLVDKYYGEGYGED